MLSFKNIPEWCKDNEYIYTGFRPVLHKWKDVFNSLLYIHNQTVNIYTHYFGSFIVINLCALWFMYEYTSTLHNHITDAQCGLKYTNIVINNNNMTSTLWVGSKWEDIISYNLNHIWLGGLLKSFIDNLNTSSYFDTKHEFMELFSWLIFFICAHICLLSSATFHLVLCQSKKTLQFGSR